ncbi:MAG: pyruvate, phosphate dikinase, partial [Dehalococcoidia bacterium]|nr:pyruvate, phosphate dikinase [Dehalococcoidia bacterium]
MKKTVVLFSDAGRNDLSLVGGKGANLGEMTKLGIPVPPGFTISTEVCNFYQHSYQYPDGLEREVMEALRHVEQAMEARFGDAQNPLLVSVRSGARVSMPGMMDTILNLGLNDATVEGVIKRTNNPRFGYDCYRRLVAMYGDVVLGLKPIAKEDIDPFEELL